MKVAEAQRKPRREKMSKIAMRDLLDAGVHFGHQTGRWNPKMAPYIYGSRNGVHIIDLSKTVRQFERAYDFINGVVGQGRSVLFIGTKKQAQIILQEESARAKQFHITNRWLGGTLTNFRTIKTGIERLKELDRMAADGSLEKFTKKEALGLSRERDRLEFNLGGIKDMPGLPGAAFVVDPRNETIAIEECNRCGIPVIALTDTNCDPDNIDHVVPANDDAIRSIRLFASAIADACIEGARRGGGHRRPEDLTSVSFEGDSAAATTAESMTAQVLRKPTTVERD
jgi:small subunit ribosomal protein S2